MAHLPKGGDAYMVSVTEALTLMISFGMLIVALLTFNHKK
ncbi:putative holin-like toxin [Salipaludibacillus sp. LMS25]|nr:putative holin-like toxin [Salipaludibacillus sp. LMS25]UTR15929.1 putative holin-like toxin [Salipaludibacillus sp. LMS25]